MYWQREYLREAATMTRNDTYRIDLPENGLLGSILFRISAAGVSGAFATAIRRRIIDYLTKIELVGDGSTIIKSITGEVAEACKILDQGIGQNDHYTQYGAGTQWCRFLLNFGRRLFDTEYGLDLSRWKNVELRVTNDATSSQYGQDFAISMLNYYLREGPGGFRGYYRTEEWRKWTTVQNETKYLELPTENKIRRVIMQLVPAVDASNVEQTAMWNLADDVELSLKTGVLRVYKGGIDDLMWENLYHYGKEYLNVHDIYITADQGYKVGLGHVLGGAWGAGSADGAGAAVIPTLEAGRTSFTQKPETYEADSPIQAVFKGLAPENCVVFRFDHPDEPESYLDVEANKTIKLDVHTRDSSSAASGTIRVVLDRLVT